MRTSRLLSWDKKRLRIVLIIFFLALFIPTAFLIRQAYSQLKWEAFHQQRLRAEQLVTLINQRHAVLIELESTRTFTDYSFLNVSADPSKNYLQRSPLSTYPVQSNIPGTIGYFQIDSTGQFSSPVLPQGIENISNQNISESELAKRRELSDRLYQLLSENQLIQERVAEKPAPVTTPGRSSSGLELPAVGSLALESVPQERLEEQELAQAGFDKLQTDEDVLSSSQQSMPKSLGRVEDLQLEDRYQLKKQTASKEAKVKREREKIKNKGGLRKERNVLPIQEGMTVDEKDDRSFSRGNLQVSMFESEVDAFEFSLLGSGHFVLYRKVWRDGHRYIQGMLIEPNPFINAVVNEAFIATGLSQSTQLTVAYQGNVLLALSGANNNQYLSRAEELEGTLLLNDSLISPLERMELIFSVNSLPAGPGGVVLTWLSLIVLIVFCVSFIIMYRLGLRQIRLARQQQDFVSAVSHELKTPLTSIRMYGEMLKEGWATDDKAKTYYHYIYDESERLTRLINNVLQLARMTRNDLKVELKAYTVSHLLDTLRSKVTSQVERAGFKLNITCDEALSDRYLNVDEDYFSQIVINLVDNALKFSGKSELKQIDISCKGKQDNSIEFSIRDYGPGIAKNQLRKIFQLFYRSENELTRETVGTGIGLSLVHQLVHIMKGQIDAINQEPGVEFRVSFPLQTEA